MVKNEHKPSYNSVRAKKSLGQNFLHDTKVLSDILTASAIEPGETIVEIGPGEGFLTRALLEKKAHVFAVELDRDLYPWLKMDFGKNPQFTLIEGDALRYNPPKGPYKLIANIPYYITSPILTHFLQEQFENGNPPTRMVLMVQKEVGEKIICKDKKHSVLSLEVQIFGAPQIVRLVAPNCFHPKPEVDSAVLQIDVYSERKIKAPFKKLLWLIKMSFAQKRKKLSNNLSTALGLSTTEIKKILEENGIQPDLRAEDLKLEDWQILFNALDSQLPSFSK